jgi:hypothetical protein
MRPTRSPCRAFVPCTTPELFLMVSTPFDKRGCAFDIVIALQQFNAADGAVRVVDQVPKMDLAV